MIEHRLYVGNLDHGAGATHLRELMQVYGRVTDSVVLQSPGPPKKTFGFVSFADEEACTAARALSGTDDPVYHRRLIVRPATARQTAVALHSTS